MSHVLFAYLPSGYKEQKQVVEDIKSLFSAHVKFYERIEENPFTGDAIQQLVLDSNYVISVSLESGEEVSQAAGSLGILSGKEVSVIRVVFGDDIEEAYEDIEIIIYEYLEALDNVVIYSPNQQKIIFNAINEG
ncbi:MAG: hypothetical protein JXR18_16565 [Neptuniibacter sp.]